MYVYRVYVYIYVYIYVYMFIYTHTYASGDQRRGLLHGLHPPERELQGPRLGADAEGGEQHPGQPNFAQPGVYIFILVLLLYRV